MQISEMHVESEILLVLTCFTNVLSSTKFPSLLSIMAPIKPIQTILAWF